MSISSESSASSGGVALLGQEKSVAAKIQKTTSENKVSSAKVDTSLTERQSLKAAPTVESRKSVASLVNENKNKVGQKVDIRV